MGFGGMYNLTSSDGTTSQAALGDEIEVKGGARWKYVQASGALAIYQLCHITAAGLAIPSTTALVGTAARPTTLGIPQFAVADTEYAWIPVGPFRLREDGSTAFKVLGAASDVLGTKQYTTGTAGVVDDAPTTGVVQGLALTETLTGAAAAACVAVTRLTSFCDT